MVFVVSTLPPLPLCAPRPLPLVTCLASPFHLAVLLAPRVAGGTLPRPRLERSRIIGVDLVDARPRPPLPLAPPLAPLFPLAIPLPLVTPLPDPLPRPRLPPLPPLPPLPARPRPLRLEIRVLASATLIRARLKVWVGGRDRSALAALMSAIFLASFSNFRFCAFNSLFLRWFCCKCFVPTMQRE